MNKVYTNIPALQKLIFTGEVSNLEEFKKYASQRESVRVRLVGIKDLDTEPLRPIYYTSEIPKARIIINSQIQEITIFDTGVEINVII